MSLRLMSLTVMLFGKKNVDNIMTIEHLNTGIPHITTYVILKAIYLYYKNNTSITYNYK